MTSYDTLQHGWQRMQYKSFKNWVNLSLKPLDLGVDALETDLQDGVRLIVLMEQLSGKKVGRYEKRPRFLMQRMDNLSIAFSFISKEGVYLQSIGPDDLVEGNLKLIMGLIWTLILHYQIAALMESTTESASPTSASPAMGVRDAAGTGDGAAAAAADADAAAGETSTDPASTTASPSSAPGTPKVASKSGGKPSAKAMVLSKVNDKLQPEFPDITVTNFTSDWTDGRVLSALVAKMNPNLVDMDEVAKGDPKENTERAMHLLETEFACPHLIDAEDLVDSPDDKSVMTYVALVCTELDKHDTVPLGEGVSSAAVEDAPASEEAPVTAEACEEAPETAEASKEAPETAKASKEAPETAEATESASQATDQEEEAAAATTEEEVVEEAMVDVGNGVQLPQSWHSDYVYVTDVPSVRSQGFSLSDAPPHDTAATEPSGTGQQPLGWANLEPGRVYYGPAGCPIQLQPADVADDSAAQTHFCMGAPASTEPEPEPRLAVPVQLVPRLVGKPDPARVPTWMADEHALLTDATTMRSKGLPLVPQSTPASDASAAESRPTSWADVSPDHDWVTVPGGTPVCKTSPDTFTLAGVPFVLHPSLTSGDPVQEAHMLTNVPRVQGHGLQLRPDAGQVPSSFSGWPEVDPTHTYFTPSGNEVALDGPKAIRVATERAELPLLLQPAPVPASAELAAADGNPQPPVSVSHASALDLAALTDSDAIRGGAFPALAPAPGPGEPGYEEGAGAPAADAPGSALGWASVSPDVDLVTVNHSRIRATNSGADEATVVDQFHLGGHTWRIPHDVQPVRTPSGSVVSRHLASEDAIVADEMEAKEAASAAEPEPVGDGADSGDAGHGSEDTAAAVAAKSLPVDDDAQEDPDTSIPVSPRRRDVPSDLRDDYVTLSNAVALRQDGLEVYTDAKQSEGMLIFGLRDIQAEQSVWMPSGNEVVRTDDDHVTLAGKVRIEVPESGSVGVPEHLRADYDALSNATALRATPVEVYTDEALTQGHVLASLEELEVGKPVWTSHGNALMRADASDVVLGQTLHLPVPESTAVTGTGDRVRVPPSLKADYDRLSDVDTVHAKGLPLWSKPGDQIGDTEAADVRVHDLSQMEPGYAYGTQDRHTVTRDGEHLELEDPASDASLRWPYPRRTDNCAVCHLPYAVFRRKRTCTECDTAVCTSCSALMGFTSLGWTGKRRVCHRCAPELRRRLTEVAAGNAETRGRAMRDARVLDMLMCGSIMPPGERYNTAEMGAMNRGNVVCACCDESFAFAHYARRCHHCEELVCHKCVTDFAYAETILREPEPSGAGAVPTEALEPESRCSTVCQRCWPVVRADLEAKADANPIFGPYVAHEVRQGHGQLMPVTSDAAGQPNALLGRHGQDPGVLKDPLEGAGISDKVLSKRRCMVCGLKQSIFRGALQCRRCAKPVCRRCCGRFVIPSLDSVAPVDVCAECVEGVRPDIVLPPRDTEGQGEVQMHLDVAQRGHVLSGGSCALCDRSFHYFRRPFACGGCDALVCRRDTYAQFRSPVLGVTEPRRTCRRCLDQALGQLEEAAAGGDTNAAVEAAHLRDTLAHWPDTADEHPVGDVAAAPSGGSGGGGVAGSGTDSELAEEAAPPAVVGTCSRCDQPYHLLRRKKQCPECNQLVCTSCTTRVAMAPVLEPGWVAGKHVCTETCLDAVRRRIRAAGQKKAPRRKGRKSASPGQASQDALRALDLTLAGDVAVDVDHTDAVSDGDAKALAKHKARCYVCHQKPTVLAPAKVCAKCEKLVCGVCCDSFRLLPSLKVLDTPERELDPEPATVCAHCWPGVRLEAVSRADRAADPRLERVVSHELLRGDALSRGAAARRSGGSDSGRPGSSSLSASSSGVAANSAVDGTRRCRAAQPLGPMLLKEATKTKCSVCSRKGDVCRGVTACGVCHALVCASGGCSGELLVPSVSPVNLTRLCHTCLADVETELATEEADLAVGVNGASVSGDDNPEDAYLQELIVKGAACELCERKFSLFHRAYRCTRCALSPTGEPVPGAKRRTVCRSCSHATNLASAVGLSASRVCRPCWDEHGDPGAVGAPHPHPVGPTDAAAGCPHCHTMFDFFHPPVRCHTCDAVACGQCSQRDDATGAFTCIACEPRPDGDPGAAVPHQADSDAAEGTPSGKAGKDGTEASKEGADDDSDNDIPTAGPGKGFCLGLFEDADWVGEPLPEEGEARKAALARRVAEIDYIAAYLDHVEATCVAAAE